MKGMPKDLSLVGDFGMRKCATKQHPSEDRISVLPDEVLSCILSFLTLKEAGRTSILSKRWRYVWTYVTGLDFDASNTLSELAVTNTLDRRNSFKWERYKCVNWVNKVLQSHKTSVLDKFRVYCDLNDSFQEEIDKWLQYAFDKRVQRLELNLKQHGPSGFPVVGHYKFPTALVEHRDWKSLENNRLGAFESLKALSLKRVKVSGDVLEFFLHNCKFLESLVVHSSSDLINMNVSGPFLALQHLEICLCHYLNSLVVCDANLTSLKIQPPNSLVLKNVPQLADIYIYGCHYIVEDVVSWLFCCFSKLKVLALSLVPEKAKEFEGKLPQLSSLKQLMLVLRLPENESIHGLTPFIGASPNVEKLVIKSVFGFMKGSGKRENVAVYTGQLVNHPVQRLKVVEICGYSGGRLELELVKYLLENAVSLQKIILDPSYPLITEEPMFDYYFRTSKVHLERDCRIWAEQQLVGLIPSHVTLQIL